jgi:oligopeptide transport system substrate-binding protein
MYWGPRAQAAVLLRIVRDESTASNLFDRGQLDVLTKVPPFDVERLRRKGVLRTDPFMTVYYLSFNLSKPPFHRREARRAVSAAIRRKELASLLGSGEQPARSWLPPGLEGFIAYEDRPAPSAADREWFKRLGPVVAGFDTSGRNSLVMEKIQQDLSVGLGLRVTLENSDWKTYVRSLSGTPPPLFRFAWMAPFRDPVPHLRVHVTGDPSNYARWSDPRYDKLVDEIATLSPGAEREAKIREAQRILVDEEAVIVPLYHYVQVHAVSEAVEGFRVNPFGMIRFDELGLK